jgi:predicted 2-oxoglutarate/Fe(II)-dependent dioxygenase YbiX
MPAALSFILFSSYFWLNEIKKLYDFNIDLNIKNIFIVKHIVQNNFCNILKTDDSFLTININLNDNNDYTGGEIVFNDDTIELQQGDMLIYNGQISRNYSGVTNGVKYVLVLSIYI